jgi:HK97 gp10 family phage protein
MVKVTGRQVFTARLRRLASPEAVEQVGQALFVGGNRIQVDAQHSITEGSISGKGHVPSAPGEPPNADTHALDRQIETEMVGPLKVVVESRDPKSKFLEFGTSRMAARPFLMPAAERQRPEVTRLVREAVSRINKGTGGTGK